MALALVASVKPRVISILNANRGAYSASVGTGSAGIGSYPFDQEVTDFCVQADGLVVTEVYFFSNLPLRNRFFATSANIAHMSPIPEFNGLVGKAEYSLDAIDWKPSAEQESKDDIEQAVLHGGYVGVTAFVGQHHLGADGFVRHASPYFRLTYPSYTKTTVLQANENHEPLIVAWALELAYKMHANAPFEYYQGIRRELAQKVLGDREELPEPGAMPGGGQ